MELVYLWVEEYKNIKKQGFNFSPRFECDYNFKLKEIEIKKGNLVYPDLLTEDINVYSINGSNGSGKSGILELLMLSCFGSRQDHDKIFANWALFYEKDDHKLYISALYAENISFNNIKVYDEKLTEFEFNSQYFHWIEEKDFFNLYYNPSIELPSTSFLNYLSKNTKEYYGFIYEYDYKPRDLNIFSFPSKKDKNINILKNENINILNMFKVKKILSSKFYQIILKTFKNNQKLLFNPKSVKFKLDKYNLEYQMKIGYVKEVLLENTNDLSLKNLYKYFVLSICSVIEVDNEKPFLEEGYFFKNKDLELFFKKAIDEEKEYIRINQKKDENNTRIHITYKSVAIRLLNNISEIFNLNLEESLGNGMKNLNEDTLLTAKLIDRINEINNPNILLNELNNKDHIIQIIPVLPSYIDITLIDENNILFNDYSYGEKLMILFIYSMIYYIDLFKRQGFKYFNIFLDEIETGFNPHWQKKLLKIFLNLINELKIKANIIVSSHSPFILSDLPKENIIFLDIKDKNTIKKYPKLNNISNLEDGNCINVSEHISIKQTFGANIHALLANGFFMNDGLIGEFAKNKINELIKYLNGKEESEIKTNEEAKKIIDIIGEPALQNTLLNMYDNKIYKNESKLEKLKRKQKEIDEEIKREENKANSNEKD